MCGIWARLGPSNDPKDSHQWVKRLEARGPEGTRIVDVNERLTFGFTRLAINGLTEAGMQPFTHGPITWMCNGEIYNAKELARKLNMDALGSDCEVIGELYLRHRDDIATFLRALDGVFALALYDKELDRLVIARDPYGIRPLFMGRHGGDISTVFASEMKAISPDSSDVYPVLPGHVYIYSVSTGFEKAKYAYHTIPWIMNPSFSPADASGLNHAAEHLRFALEESVRKRLLTERPVAALLSGGVDSSLIASLVQWNLNQLNLPPLKTFSIGFEGSQDLTHARMVADWIHSDHTEVIMTPDQFFEAIPEVIQAIESCDTTTVRASVGNYLVAKYIREHTDCKVVFNGDGSDELFGGYLYFNNAPSEEAFHAETARLLTDIHTFDVLRSDRCISANGLEARTPFLDKQFVAVARSIHPSYLRPVPGKQVEKYLLRYAFDDGVTLPLKVLWRRKEAFSDGVSTPEKAWFQEIQERVSKIVPSDWEEKSLAFLNLRPRTPEEFYYRMLFTKIFGPSLSVFNATMPYRWMPKWCPETTDPSARTLKIYDDDTPKNETA